MRGVDVPTASEDGASELPDPALLDRAATLRRVLFTQDVDLPAEGTRRQRAARPFGGIVYAHQRGIATGQCIEELALLMPAGEPEEYADRIVCLPL